MKSSITHCTWPLLLAFLMSGCASHNAEMPQSIKVEKQQSSRVEKPSGNQVEKPPSYEDTIMSRPLPHDDTTRLSECGVLVSEIHRQQGALNYAASLEPGSPKMQEVMATYQSNINVLRTRMKQVGCNRSVSPVPPAQIPK